MNVCTVCLLKGAAELEMKEVIKTLNEGIQSLQPEKGSRKLWEKLDVGNLASRKV